MFSSNEKIAVFEPENEIAKGQNMGWLTTVTTLWSEYPLVIVRKKIDGLEALDVRPVLIQKAHY
jgi:hypothetical protein